MDELRISSFSSIALAQALDTTNTVTNPNFSTRWYGQTLVTRDGSDALQNGLATLTVDSCFTSAVNIAANEWLIIDFDWKIDTNENNFLTFYVDTSNRARIQGKRDWSSQRVIVRDAGSHTLEWCYDKNVEGAVDQDRAWIDRLSLTRLDTSNSQAAALQEALDNNNLNFTLSGDSNWFSQSIETNDAMDALRSGGIGDNQSSCFEATVPSDPAVRYLSFYWKISSEQYYDNLRLYVNDSDTLNINGERDWQKEEIILESNRTYDLEWCYSKSNYNSSGSDAGWVDQISIREAIPSTLADGHTALDITDPNQALRFIGVADWFIQTEVSSDGTDALQSGYIKDSQSSCVESDLEGAADISFYWRVSSEEDFDFLRFYIDGAFIANIHGVREWAQYSYSISSSGSHTLRWCYEKDSSTSSGSDSAWIDQLVITPR